MAGKTITGEIIGLSKPRRGKSTDKKSNAKGTIKAKAGVGKPKPTSSVSGGTATGGFNIATEKENSRVYREEYKTIRSSDGLFVLQYKELYTIQYVTESNTTVTFKYLPIEE
jgi:hypothetical protein